ncbi:unnamed protein product, partial [Sphacelaria rigidula]
KVDRAGYKAVVEWTVEDLVLSFFDIMFPPEAIDLIVKYTNDCVDFCTAEEEPTGHGGKQQKRELRHIR